MTTITAAATLGTMTYHSVEARDDEHVLEPAAAPAQLVQSVLPVNCWKEFAGHEDGDDMPASGH